ncbi:MAG: TetR/AcrR family transcriptional regulator [Lewinellaceae bacterium]|nr:TetR/AcrR family transcriptional regulator [Phaeodactylibacter sp.]MCB0614087.1 TetR/AcrR family transcriptional regulator [Phaeodactylibacter sp.]MCB9349476.1 TetR/AcrR family transcriptional regulator [Lewinellaceae bacterium]
MADISTKQKILNASIRLFNENGLANVRLQQIADETGISVGNLAYHFRNKEAIVSAVNETLNDDIKEILSAYRLFPNLIDFDNQLSKYFSFLEKYPFYFLDLLEMERAYPEVKAHCQQYITKMISQIRKRFDFNQQRGLFIKEPYPGIYDVLADSIWVLMSFWMPQRLIRNEEPHCEGRFKQMAWSQLFPYFTEKGKEEYDQLIRPMLNQHFS